jgi:hypothetical protein
MKIKLDEDFSETGLCSWISYNTLKDIIVGIEQKFDRNNKLPYKITGFIINNKGIQIQKSYLKNV